MIWKFGDGLQMNRDSWMHNKKQCKAGASSFSNHQIFKSANRHRPSIATDAGRRRCGKGSIWRIIFSWLPSSLSYCCRQVCIIFSWPIECRNHPQQKRLRGQGWTSAAFPLSIVPRLLFAWARQWFLRWTSSSVSYRQACVQGQTAPRLKRTVFWRCSSQ